MASLVKLKHKADEIDKAIDKVGELGETKVDKIDGKQLSTEDYTTAEKTKLGGLSNYNDSEVQLAIAILRSTLGCTARNRLKPAEIADTKAGITQAFEEDGKFVASGVNTSAYTQDLCVRDTFPTGQALRIRGADVLTRALYQYCAVDDTGQTVYKPIGTSGVIIPADWRLRYVYVQRTATGGDGLDIEIYPVIQNADIEDETYTPYKPTIEERLTALETKNLEV